MLTIAIVEDEDREAELLSGYINHFCSARNTEYNIKRFTNGADFIRSYRPVYDIVFMDIMLPGQNGVETARELRELDEGVTLIFVTNMANLAVKGYEVDALDFIIKPVKYDSFAMKMERVLKALSARRSVDISIRTDRAIKVVSSARITYIEVIHHSLVYHMQDGELRSRGTLDALEKQLAGEHFVRCNACYLVNMRYITEVSGDDVIVAGDTLKISRAKKKSFMQAFTNYLGNGV